MHIGKAIRLERIFNRNTGRTIVVPMDHGVTVGPIDGLVDMRQAVGKVVEGGANAVIEHKGLVRCGHRAKGKDIGLIVHLSASTTLSPFPNAKSLVASVEDAIRLGADAISIHCNLGDETEAAMLNDFGKIASDAANWGMPLLAMVYARGPKVKNEYAPEIVAHCARVGTELERTWSRSTTPATSNPSPTCATPAVSPLSSQVARNLTAPKHSFRWCRTPWKPVALDCPLDATFSNMKTRPAWWRLSTWSSMATSPLKPPSCILTVNGSSNEKSHFQIRPL